MASGGGPGTRGCQGGQDRAGAAGAISFLGADYAAIGQLSSSTPPHGSPNGLNPAGGPWTNGRALRCLVRVGHRPLVMGGTEHQVVGSGTGGLGPFVVYLGYMVHRIRRVLINRPPSIPGTSYLHTKSTGQPAPAEKGVGTFRPPAIPQSRNRTILRSCDPAASTATVRGGGWTRPSRTGEGASCRTGAGQRCRRSEGRWARS